MVCIAHLSSKIISGTIYFFWYVNIVSKIKNHLHFDMFIIFCYVPSRNIAALIKLKIVNNRDINSLIYLY